MWLMELQGTLQDHLPEASGWTCLLVQHYTFLSSLPSAREEDKWSRVRGWTFWRRGIPCCVPCDGKEVDCSPAKVAEKDLCGVWADQGPACSVVEIGTVLGPKVSRRQKLSRHLDKDAKDFLILPRRRERCFQTVHVHSPQSCWPLPALSGTDGKVIEEQLSQFHQDCVRKLVCAWVLQVNISNLQHPVSHQGNSKEVIYGWVLAK